MDIQQLNQIIIGNILKEQRESQGFSQIDIAAKLGYKNYNYISMLENGRSNIPVKRVIDIINAYEFDKSMIPVFIKKLLPSVWEIIDFWIRNEKNVPKNEAEIEKYNKDVDEKFIETLDKFGLDSYKPMLEGFK